MVTIGVLVRVDESTAGKVELGLNAIEGVKTLALEQPGTLGAVIRAADLDQAHATLCNRVQRVEGVLCAWPVHTQLGEGSPLPPTGCRQAKQAE